MMNNVAGILLLVVIGFIGYQIYTAYAIQNRNQSVSGFASGPSDSAERKAAASMAGASPTAPAIPSNGMGAPMGASAGATDTSSMPMPSMPSMPSIPMGSSVDGDNFANPSEPSSMPFAAAAAPSNCYPKAQLNAKDLLPSDPNSVWAQVNPPGAGDISGKNFINAGLLIGVNTVGQSNRNSSRDLRSEPANPQVTVSPFNNSTIEPDLNRRSFEIQ